MFSAFITAETGHTRLIVFTVTASLSWVLRVIIKHSLLACKAPSPVAIYIIFIMHSTAEEKALIQPVAVDTA